MSSAEEAEIGAMYINARKAVPARQTLDSVVTNNVQHRQTKAMGMRFHWIRDRTAQGQFRFY